MVNINRRDFLALLTATVAGPALLASCGGKKDVGSFFESKKKLKLSLSQWALHREQFGKSKEDYPQWQKMLQTDPDRVLQGTLNPLDFPAVAKSEFGMDAVEYVNTFFYGHGNDDIYLNELRKRSDHEGIRNLLIMVDEEGMLGDPDSKLRALSVERHKKWLYAATVLGCHSIRVNLHSKGNKEEQMKLSADGLSQVCELAKPFNLHVIIENHGGMSSEPNWLIETIKATGKDNTGTMVDFDNFDYSEEKIWGGEFRYDRYEGVKLLLPYAKSVSSKAHAFDAQGFETSIDFGKMVNMIKESGFDGYTSVEYEGDKLTEREGVKATKALLERFDA